MLPFIPLFQKFAFSNLFARSKALVLPFVELPADEPNEKKEQGPNAAETLFTLFTADIIQQDVQFLR